jgi:hypothetical protein
VGDLTLAGEKFESVGERGSQDGEPVAAAAR